MQIKGHGGLNASDTSQDIMYDGSSHTLILQREILSRRVQSPTRGVAAPREDIGVGQHEFKIGLTLKVSFNLKFKIVLTSKLTPPPAPFSIDLLQIL